MCRATFPKTIEFELQLAPSLPLFSADPGHLHQALLNLCVNARDAMPNGGTALFTTSLIPKEQIPQKLGTPEQDRYIVLEVADTGMGMDEETAKRIFEPFFTTKVVGKGTGLGLAVVYGVVKSHNGFVDVKSAPGMGTTFRVYIPVRPLREEMSKGTTEEDIRGGAETILLVEDESPLTEIVVEQLREKGYNVHTAADGIEAVEFFSAQPADIALVVSDIGLPRLSGIEAVKRMRKLNPALRVILASGYIDPEMRKEINALPVEAIVEKPFNAAELLHAVREALDRP
jgi:CheY-like chemotaxis protein